MKAGYTHTLRQSVTFNHSMIQAVKVMRMSELELRELLTEISALNPFVEVEQDARDYGSGAGQRDDFDLPAESSVSLYRHLADQFPMVFQTSREMAIAQAFLQEIEPSGWLSVSVEHVAASSGFEQSECEDVLSGLQTLEPAGVFARDLRECLRLQAIDRDLLDDDMEKLIAHLDQLMTCDPVTLAKRLGISATTFIRRLEQIRRMDPKPGSAFTVDDTILRGSDVVVHVVDHEVAVELSQSSFPTLRQSLNSRGDADARTFEQAMLGKLVQEARALQSAIEMRKSTTLAVVAAIFARQGKFLVHGYPALVPMSMSEIADDIGVSEATVSRVLSGLTIQCPPGCIPAKSLFCSPVSYGAQPHTKHVAFQFIKKLIACEDKASPITDQDIASAMQNAGLTISRRTVSKYRQSLGLSTPALRRKAAELSALAAPRSTSGSDVAGKANTPKMEPEKS